MSDEDTTKPVKSTGNPIGRPPSPAQTLKKKKVGRPKGEAGIMKDYRERMLNSPKSRKVLTAIFDAALDDDHKGQTAAWKIITDRILPVAGFEKEAGTLARSSIQVNITGVPNVNIESEEPLEGEFEQMDPEE
jgi:hypothetical protein